MGERTGRLRGLQLWGTWTPISDSWSERAQMLYAQALPPPPPQGSQSCPHRTAKPSPWELAFPLQINIKVPRGAPTLGQALGLEAGPTPGSARLSTSPASSRPSSRPTSKLECLSALEYLVKCGLLGLTQFGMSGAGPKSLHFYKILS